MITEIEQLKEELRTRGATGAQTNAKMIPMIVEAITGTDLFTDEQKAYETIQELKQDAVRRRHYMEVEQAKAEKAMEKLRQEFREMQEYIDRFYTALEETETPEARDRLRIAQTFVNSTRVTTAYDNTAFIVGLGGILSGETIAPVKEIKKINRELIDPTVRRI